MTPTDRPPPAPPEPEAEDPGALSRVQISLDLAGDRRVRITIEALDGEGLGDPAQTVSFTLPQPERDAQASTEGPEGSWVITAAPAQEGRLAAPVPRLDLVGVRQIGRWLAGGWTQVRASAQSRGLTLSMALFGLALVLYLATRLIGLEDFPIYFFTDEAVQTVLAADLVRDNFVGYDKVFLPTYFQNGPQYNLSLSVYLQVIPYLFFGKSVFVTRAVSVLVSLIAAIAVGLIGRDIYKIPYWWSGVLLLSITPAWFLHSRTAFETVIATSLYAAFLYLYMLYRTRSPQYLYAALVVAGLVFYSYSPAQIYIAVTGFLLLVSDARYHWENRQVVLRGLGVLFLIALPYLRFRLTHGEAPLEQLRNLGSYWLRPGPFDEKARQYFNEYLFGLSPGYWYFPNERDLARHVMDAYGHILRPTLPFAMLGLFLVIREIRRPAYRVPLIAILAAPAGAAVVQIGITRLLVFVVPAALFAALGISRVLAWLERLRLPRRLLAVALFSGLSVINLVLLQNALVKGPTWFKEYGLGGMQYGARQIFDAVDRRLETGPEAKIMFSPTWANGTDVLARFFLQDPLPIQMGSITGYLERYQEIEPETVFVLPVDEYEAALESGKFADVQVEQTLPYPDGRTGFYFVRLNYVEDIEQIFAAERAERARLIEDKINLDGETIRAKYSRLDMGSIETIFDGDPETLARTLEANPAVIELEFPAPRQIHGFTIITGSTDVEITVRLYADADSPPREVVRTFRGSVDAPEVDIGLDEPFAAKTFHLEVRDTTQLEQGHVHIWELRLR